MNAFENWDVEENFKWERDLDYQVQWTSIDSILTSWKSRRGVAIETVIIPKKQITIALGIIAQNIVVAPNAPVEPSDSESGGEEE
jgi:hypothetical protein